MPGNLSLTFKQITLISFQKFQIEQIILITHLGKTNINGSS